MNAKGAWLPHHKHRLLRQAGQELAQIAGAERDAASCGDIILARAMKKDGAASLPLPWPYVVVENDDEIIETVVAPQFFMMIAAGEPQRTIIGR